jgi:hypothetical protein
MKIPHQSSNSGGFSGQTIIIIAVVTVVFLFMLVATSDFNPASNNNNKKRNSIINNKKNNKAQYRHNDNEVEKVDKEESLPKKKKEEKSHDDETPATTLLTTNSPPPSTEIDKIKKNKNIKKECHGADFYSWTHPESQPPNYLTDREKRLQTLAEFSEYFAKLPGSVTDKKLRGGMQLEHQSALWHILKMEQPEVVIESGLWRGLGSRLIRHAAPNAMLYFFDPLTESDRYHAPPPSKYFEGANFIDMRDYDFPELTPAQKRRTVIVSDDHFGILERMRIFVDKGFSNATIVWDDNYGVPFESNFAPKQVFLENECQWDPVPENGDIQFPQVHYSILASPAQIKKNQRYPRMRISRSEIQRRREQFRALADWYVELPAPWPQWPKVINVARERERRRKRKQPDPDSDWEKREAPPLFSSANEFWKWAGPTGLKPNMPQTVHAGELSNQMCAIKIHDFAINIADVRPIQDCPKCADVPLNKINARETPAWMLTTKSK